MADESTTSKLAGMRAMNFIRTERIEVNEVVKIDTSIVLPNTIRPRPAIPAAGRVGGDTEYNYTVKSHGKLRVVLELSGEGLGEARVSVTGNDIAFYMVCMTC